MGKLGADAQNVNGTGQSVGDLKKIGYSQNDINGMGTSPNPYQKAMKIGLGGLQGMGQQQPQMQQGAPPIQIQQAPQVDPSYFQPNRNRFQQGPDPNDLFFGRGGF